MEIAESTAVKSRKQMSATLTSPRSAESSGKNSNNNTSGTGCGANKSATALSTAETRTKDSKNTTTKQNTTDMNAAGGVSDTSDKDMDIEIIEIPSTKIATTTGEYKKIKLNDDKDQKQQQQKQSTKVITSNIAGGAGHIDHDLPIISISDGEDCVGQSTPPAQKVNRKRSSVGGGSTVGDDQSFGLKRRKIKVAGAPKMPLTGYVRYMNERRETLRKELPTKTAIEHTKIIGEEWQKMSEDKKAPYMKAAEIDKQRYLAELHTFLKERPDVLACELAKNKQARKNPGETVKPVLKEKSQSIGNIKSPNKETTNATSTAAGKEKTQHSTEKHNSPSPAPTAAAATTTPLENKTRPATAVPGEIPIFTNEFLEHNKIFDMELRTLRKTKQDLEQQNAVLEKHVENMKFGVEKMTNENDELAEKNRLLELYLDKLKSKLAHALSGLSIPSQPHGATLDNIEKYMCDLYKMATTNTHGPASLNKAKDIIRKLDLQINL